MAKKSNEPGPGRFNEAFKELGPLAQARRDAAAAERNASEQRRDAAKKRAAAPPPAEDLTDEELFLRAVGDTKPVAKGRTRVAPPKPPTREAQNDEELAVAELHALVDGQTPFRFTQAEEQVSGAAPGVSHELIRELEHGNFPHRRHLDLHGHTRDEAKTALLSFIVEARRAGERCVLVITGRGKSSPGGVAVLREALPEWLGRQPLRAHVLAFSTARAVDGGPGAFYVLLRKSAVKPSGTGHDRTGKSPR